MGILGMVAPVGRFLQPCRAVTCPLPGRKGGMCRAGVSFLLGFFCSDSTFRVACVFFPFLCFLLRSQSLMNWSERSSGFKEEEE